MGETAPAEGYSPSPLVTFTGDALKERNSDGYFVSSKCMGCYIHGILDNGEFIDFLLSPYKDKISESGSHIDYNEFKQKQYDALAAHVRSHTNMELLYKILQDD